SHPAAAPALDAAALDAPALKVIAGGAPRGGGLRRWLAAAATATLVAGAGLLVTSGRPDPRVGDQALRPDRPAPLAPAPAPPVVHPAPAPPPTAPGGSDDPLEALSAEERALVLELDLLSDLRELEELGLLDAAELFDDLEAEEFDEG